MRCPTCPEERLVMADRQGIEIDYCPNCRGVWLDRGELDKLIERAAAPAPAPAPPANQYGNAAPMPQPSPEQWQNQGPAPAYGAHKYHHKYHQKPYKKKSMLGELFDF